MRRTKFKFEMTDENKRNSDRRERERIEVELKRYKIYPATACTEERSDGRKQRKLS